MDFNSYVDRIEARIENPDELERLRQQAQTDEQLSADERERVGERIGMYLADAQRALEPFDEDTVPDDEGGDGASTE